jgi:hypothetical protein
MAITAPIYNEPECSSAACHFHLPSQKVLGTLDIGLSRTELERSLTMLRIQMIIFTLMCLILTVSGVTALLRRNVFLPIQRLRKYIEFTAKNGDIPEPPPHLPHDLDVIAASYYNVKLNIGDKKQSVQESVNDSNKGK